MELKEPTTAIEPGNYLAVIRDADDTYHYWLKDGKYDGYDKVCRKLDD